MDILQLKEKILTVDVINAKELGIISIFKYPYNNYINILIINILIWMLTIFII